MPVGSWSRPSILLAHGRLALPVSKTQVNKRQDVVTSFNRHNVGQVFLLSTTAGGAGLNLTGANCLILLDRYGGGDRSLS